jgi:FkbM family methyltransferase
MKHNFLRIKIVDLFRILGLYTFLRFLKNVNTISRNSYSQTGEDSLISQYFEDESFTYVDIGAGEPVYGSNTYCFYRRGMRGILVDPLPANKLLARIIRPRDIFIESLVGDRSGPQQFWEFEAYEYSTMDPEVADRLKREGIIKVKKQRFVNMMTLQEIAKLIPNPELPWLLSVDVEGVDFSVIKSFDFKISRPRVICIEDHGFIQNLRSEQHDFILRLGYRLESQTSISLIYIDTRTIHSENLSGL